MNPLNPQDFVSFSILRNSFITTFLAMRFLAPQTSGLGSTNNGLETTEERTSFTSSTDLNNIIVTSIVIMLKRKRKFIFLELLSIANRLTFQVLERKYDIFQDSSSRRFQKINQGIFFFIYQNHHNHPSNLFSSFIFSK